MYKEICCYEPGCSPEVLYYGKYALNINRWDNKNADVCVFYDNSVPYIGTRWDNDGGINYPGAIVGTNFCNWESTWGKFPIRWGDIISWTVKIDWEYIRYPTGTWNNSFDLYFVDNCNTPYGKGAIKMNPMIWIQSGGAWDYIPSGGSDTVSDGYNEYYYDIPEFEWPRIIFILKNPPEREGSLTINVKRLFQQIEAKRGIHLNTNWIIPDIQWGMENVTYRGNASSGEVRLTKYDIEINGTTIDLYNNTSDNSMLFLVGTLVLIGLLIAK